MVESLMPSPALFACDANKVLVGGFCQCLDCIGMHGACLSRLCDGLTMARKRAHVLGRCTKLVSGMLRRQQIVRLVNYEGARANSLFSPHIGARVHDGAFCLHSRARSAIRRRPD